MSQKSDQPPRSLKLLLFDIDGTLILSGGAGRRAMSLGFQEITGIPGGFETVSMMGRTDTGILREVLENHGMAWEEDMIRRFKKSYFRILSEELGRSRDGQEICPGVNELLPALEKRRDVLLGLLTGNWSESSGIKLRHFGLARFFPIGVYADDSAKRENLVPIMLNRVKQERGLTIAGQDVFVIGDTPLDVQCGKPHGVQTIAVATGIHSTEELRQAGPDHLFENFLDRGAFFRAIGIEGP